MFCGPTQEPVLATTNTGNKSGEVLEKNAVEWTGRIEISKEEIPGSKHSMHGYILTYSRLLRENVLNGETDVRMAFLSLSQTFKIGDLCPPQEECINQSCMEFLCFLYSQLR